MTPSTPDNRPAVVPQPPIFVPPESETRPEAATEADLRVARHICKWAYGYYRGGSAGASEAYAYWEGTAKDWPGTIAEINRWADDIRAHVLAETAELRALIVKKDEALALIHRETTTNSWGPYDIRGIKTKAEEALVLTPKDLEGCVVVKRSELGVAVPRPAEVGFVDYFRHIMFAHGHAMKDKGFWDNRNIPGAEVWVKLGLNALVCSELGEATTGIRKDCADDHLTNRSMEVCEMADVILRVMDYCAFYKLPVAEVLIEKMEYNATRAHKHGDKKA